MPKEQKAPASDETRDAAVKEMALRRVSGVQITGIGEKYGVSDATVYLWAKRASGKKEPARHVNKGNKGGRGGPGYSAEQRATILAAWRAQKEPRLAMTSFAKKHGVHGSTLSAWLAEAGDRKPGHGTQTEIPDVTKKVREEATERRVYPIEFKQRIVEAYTTRRPGVTADDIAGANGITTQIVHAWVTATREGKIPPAPNGGGIVERPVQTALALSNGHGHDAATIELEQLSLTGLASMRLAQLEAQNKAFRKIISSLMENANQTDLKKINLLLLEQL